jgi:hypothetical protein
MAKASTAGPRKKTGDKMESLIERTDPEADERDKAPADDDEETFERDPDDEGPEDSDDE